MGVSVQIVEIGRLSSAARTWTFDRGWTSSKTIFASSQHNSSSLTRQCTIPKNKDPQRTAPPTLSQLRFMHAKSWQCPLSLLEIEAIHCARPRLCWYVTGLEALMLSRLRISSSRAEPPTMIFLCKNLGHSFIVVQWPIHALSWFSIYATQNSPY